VPGSCARALAASLRPSQLIDQLEQVRTYECDVWGAQTQFSRRWAVFVDQSAEAIATLDLVWSR
jgi:hypothetical protein